MIQELAKIGVRLEPAGKRHARELSRILRPNDMKEVWSLGGRDAESAIRMSLNRSGPPGESWAAYLGEDLLAIFGCGVRENADIAWAMTSLHVDLHTKVFWQASKIVVAHFHDKYALMMNMVPCFYTETIRWLSRLGFRVSPPEKFGPRGELFCRVMLARQRLVEVAGV